MADAVGLTHHVKVEDHHHLVRIGSYSKSGAPIFGPRFSTGDPDYSNLSLWQYWVQRCWVGGFGAETWSDDLMYDEVAGVDSTQHEVLVLTRDLALDDALTSATYDAAVKEFCVFNDVLYCLEYAPDSDPTVEPPKLWKTDGDGTWSVVKTFTGYEVRSIAVFNNRLWVGNESASSGESNGKLLYMNDDETFSSIDRPSGIGALGPQAMMAYRGNLYVAFRRGVSSPNPKLFRLKTDDTWDGSTHFFEFTDSDWILSMDIHLGFLWMGSRNGRVYRTDGNNTFEMWKFEDGSVLRSVRSFDGRLFLGVEELIDGTESANAVLYQLSGSSVTELKRWGKVGRDCSTGYLRVIGRRMFFGAPSLMGMGDGFGIGCYDAREDAYHMFATNRDGSTYAGGSDGSRWLVDDLILFNGKIYVGVRGHGVFWTSFSFRDVTRFQATYDTTAIGASPASGNGGWITSSEFDAGTPGLMKLWDAITIDVDLPTTDCTVSVDVSLDGGQNWQEVDTIDVVGTASRLTSTLSLVNDDGDALVGTRLKWRLWLRTADSTRSPQVRGVAVRYLPIPEPNWRWDFVAVLSDRQETLDGTVQLLDGSDPEVASLDEKRAALESIFRAQLPFTFTDIDGVDWRVLMLDLREDVRYIGPSEDGVIERDVRIVLHELKDSYEFGISIPGEPDPPTARLYHSAHLSGEGAFTAEQAAAPNLGDSSMSSSWEVKSSREYYMFYPAPASTMTTDSIQVHDAVNMAANDKALAGFMIRLDEVGDLLDAIQAGGTVRGQQRTRSRYGIGISEGLQNDLLETTGRIYRPGTGFVATLWAVGSMTGTLKFPAQSTKINRSFSGAYTAYASALSTDYLCVEYGFKHITPTSGGAGGAIGFYDSAGSGNDLPEDQSSSAALNSWIELIGSGS